MRNCGGMSLRGAGAMPIVASMSGTGGGVGVVAVGLFWHSAVAAGNSRQATGGEKFRMQFP